MFKINPVNENSKTSMKIKSPTMKTHNKELFLYGVTGDKINDILEKSFTCRREDIRLSRIKCATNNFVKEFSSGINYCSVKNEVKKCSFVFVTSLMYVDRNFISYSESFASEDVGVGRNNFRNNTGDKDSYKVACLTCTCPEYLLVLEA